MSKLTIKDLARVDELDAGEMAAVRGGMAKDLLPGNWASMLDFEKNVFGIDAKQLLKQGQNTVVDNGNNAAFVTGIDPATPNLPISNHVSFSH